MAGLIFALGLVGIAIDFYVAVKFKKIAEDKGYDSMEYFLVCFFLMFIGYIMVAALPDRKRFEMPVYGKDDQGYAPVQQASKPVAAVQQAASAPVSKTAETQAPAATQAVQAQTAQTQTAQQSVPVQATVTQTADQQTAEAVEAEKTAEQPAAEQAAEAEKSQKTNPVPVSPQISIAPDFELPVPDFVKREAEKPAKTPEEIAAEEAAAKAAAEEAAAKAAAEAAAKAAEEEAARLAEEERSRGVGRAPFKPEVHPEVSIDSPQAQLDKFGELPDL